MGLENLPEPLKNALIEILKAYVDQSNTLDEIKKCTDYKEKAEWANKFRTGAIKSELAPAIEAIEKLVPAVIAKEKAFAGSSAGGIAKSKANEETRNLEKEIAAEIWRKNRHLSIREVARRVAKKTNGKAGSIEKRIAAVRPS